MGDIGKEQPEIEVLPLRAPSEPAREPAPAEAPATPQPAKAPAPV